MVQSISWGRALALLSTLGLSAILALGPSTVSATPMAVNVVITPGAGGPAGGGLGTYDKDTGALVVTAFSFVGPLGSAVVPDVTSPLGKGFVLDWVIPGGDDGRGGTTGNITFSVGFVIDKKLVGTGVEQFGGTYSDTIDPNNTVSLSGTWKLTDATPPTTTVPEPGSLALLGGVLVALGLARRFSHKV